MQSSSGPTVAVVLPGSGSDADFVLRAFEPAFAVLDITTIAVEPDPLQVVGSYLAALDDAADRHGAIVAAGISIGAAVALEWAARRPAAAAAVLATMPAWTGAPDTAPAAHSARFTAQRLRADGLDAVTEQMRASSPPWLAEALARSWAQHWPHLARALDEAADYTAPDAPQLARIDTPVGVVGVVDDAVHPFEVAWQWAALLPNAALAKVTLDEVGADPATLGRAGIAALTELGWSHLGPSD
ncbi:alpha/beta hydrolase [Aldersonia sp. NBC_00410]|uniref:alpha/beta hydrolase n=1 Tax=Aldersonia sp. NBC_00410 TaxID=2975954 RepID=UPI0022597B72|nr:alpha/beta hydrolase [Aldersonia sp. NBC_00410]MCX5042561.1 alpha/beta hydrolase [Aldersonia sp. NBC_00410]